MNIYILRHGQTDYNKEGKFQGQIDIPLNGIGIEQAKKAKILLKDIKFDLVISSPLIRAFKTAQIVTGSTNIKTDYRIIERSFGLLEGQYSIPDYEEKIDIYKVETYENMCIRVYSFLDELIKNNINTQNILVVCHEGIAQIIQTYFDKSYNINNWKSFRLQNGTYKKYVIGGTIKMNIKDLENIDLKRTSLLEPQKLKKTDVHKEHLNIVYLMIWTQVCGGSKVLLEYANRIQEKGHNVSIVTYDEKPQWFKLNDNVNFIQVPDNADWKNYIPDCDVLVATSWRCIYTAIESKKGPVVFFEQGGSHLFETDNISPLKKSTVQNRFKLPHFVYTVSSYAKDALKTVYDCNSSVIPIAIDNTIFYPRTEPLNNDTIEITLVGSEDFKFKNVDNILKAYRILNEKYNNLHLNWITQTEPHQNKEPAIVNPPQKMIGDILRKTHIYICNSEYESFGLPTLEAMTCGATVITTDTGGMRDFVQENYNALVTKHHDINDIVEKVSLLIEKPDLMQQLSSNGIETAKQFSWENCVSKTLDYYKEIASYSINDRYKEEDLSR